MSGQEEVNAIIGTIAEHMKLTGKKPDRLEISPLAYQAIKKYFAPLPSFKDPKAKSMLIAGVRIERKL